MKQLVEQKRIEQICAEGCIDEEKWALAKVIIDLQSDLKAWQKNYNEDLRESAREARFAADEAYWHGKQGEDYGSW